MTGSATEFTEWSGTLHLDPEGGIYFYKWERGLGRGGAGFSPDWRPADDGKRGDFQAQAGRSYWRSPNEVRIGRGPGRDRTNIGPGRGPGG